jgi:Yip1 domain
MNNLVQRVIALLKSPKSEWPVIAAEPASVGALYKGYIIPLAALPAICMFVKSSFIGSGMFGISYRSGIGVGLSTAVISYLLSLLLVYVMALIIDALAPTFSGEKNRIQALKTAAYGYTAAWVAGIGALVPGLSFLIVLAGAIYSIYLLYLGLPVTMKAPPEKAAGYLALVVVVAIVLSWIITAVSFGVLGSAAYMGGGALGALGGGTHSSSDVQFDENSALGKLAAAGKKMEAASKQLEAAQKTGDAKAQGDALGAMMASALGGGAAEALAPERLKGFVPEQLAGMPRTRISVERNGALGIQIANARATYANADGKGIDLEITDSGGASGLMGLAAWANVESDSETATGFERTRKEGGRIVHEKWDSEARRGEYSVVLGERFVVKAEGDAASIDQLKGAVSSVDLAALEALKNEGVKR